MEKLVPQDLESEKTLLSSILVKPGLAEEVYGKLEPKNFYSTKHQLIYQSVENVIKSNEVVDIVTVSDDLMKTKNLEAIGGRAFINDIALGYITSTTYKSCIKSIKNKYNQRMLLKLSQNITDGCYNNTDADVLLDNIQNQLYEFNFGVDDKEGKDLTDVLIDRYEDISTAYMELQQGGELVIKNAIPTGLTRLDGFLRGGFKDGELTLIAARSRVGKTAFEVFLERSIAEQPENIENVAGASFQLETGIEELADRNLGNITGIKKAFFTYVNNLDEHSFGYISKALDNVSKSMPMKIFTHPDFNALEIESKAKQYFNKIKRKGIIFIDNLQIMEDIHKGKSDIEVSTNITRDCKKIAQRLQVPVILLCQLVKDAEDNSEPVLRNIRGSMQVIANADNIILLHRDTDDKNDITEMDVILEKVRKGQPGRIKYTVDLSTNKFYEKV